MVWPQAGSMYWRYSAAVASSLISSVNLPENFPDEHGEGLAVLGGKVLRQAEALVVDEEEAGGAGAVLPDLDLLELGLDELQAVGAVCRDGGERGAVVVFGGHRIIQDFRLRKLVGLFVLVFLSRQ